MNHSKILLLNIILILSVVSCSGINHLKNNIERNNDTYSYNDRFGKYLLHVNARINEKKGEYHTINIITQENGNKKKFLERTKTISSIGTLKTSRHPISTLRPKQSIHEVWLEGKKYVSKTKLIIKKKSLLVSYIDPNTRKKVKKLIKFPETKGVFCYYSQLIDCIKATGFITKSQKANGGEMNFYIIFDSYPYIQEQYRLPDTPFVKANMSYETLTRKKDTRYTLSLNNQSIFYVLDNKKKLKKYSWVAQGITVIRETKL